LLRTSTVLWKSTDTTPWAWPGGHLGHSSQKISFHNLPPVFPVLQKGRTTVLEWTRWRHRNANNVIFVWYAQQHEYQHITHKRLIANSVPGYQTIFSD